MSKPKTAFRKRWLTYTISGLLLTGAGLALTIDAAIYKSQGASIAMWVIYGSFALIVFNSGLCLFGQGIIYRIKYLKKK